jgi:hypothetical protein
MGIKTYLPQPMANVHLSSRTHAELISVGRAVNGCNALNRLGTNGFLAILPWDQSLYLSRGTCQLPYTVPGIADPPFLPNQHNCHCLFDFEQQRPKGIVNIAPMTDEIYFDNRFSVVKAVNDAVSLGFQ